MGWSPVRTQHLSVPMPGSQLPFGSAFPNRGEVVRGEQSTAPPMSPAQKHFPF